TATFPPSDGRDAESRNLRYSRQRKTLAPLRRDRRSRRIRTLRNARRTEPQSLRRLLSPGAASVSNAILSIFGWRGPPPQPWYFDRLPPTARRALAGAALEWSGGR